MNKQPSAVTKTASGAVQTMNNWVGLLIAVTLAVVAGVLNWKYLERKTNEIEMVSFMAIAPNASLDSGDTFREEHFATLNVPFNNSQSLALSAVYFKDRDTVVGMKALRSYRGGDVILRQELKTPPAELNLQKNEMAMWVPVGGSSMVSALLTPGDMVSFYVPKPGTMTRRMAPPKTTEEPEQDSENQPLEWNHDGLDEVAIVSEGTTEIIGPFRVISVGQRLGSKNVSRATGQKTGQSNTLGIAIQRVGKGFEPNAEKLRNRIYSTGFRHAGVLLHPREEKKNQP